MKKFHEWLTVREMGPGPMATSSGASPEQLRELGKAHGVDWYYQGIDNAEIGFFDPAKRQVQWYSFYGGKVTPGRTQDRITPVEKEWLRTVKIR